MQNLAAIAGGLREIAALLRFAAAPKFKRRAYEHAAEIVDTVGDELPTLIEQQRLLDLSGIGASLAAQIEQLWNTGTSSYLERLRRENPPGAGELVQVPGLTPRRIRLLSEHLGVDSVRALRDACEKQLVRTLPGFGPKTEQRLVLACDQWLAPKPSAGPPSILLSEGLALAEALTEALPERSSLAGELRRGHELAPKLDLVVQGDRAEVLEHLARVRRVLRVDRAAGVAHLGEGVTVRVHAAPPSRWGNVLVEATGNEAHVAAVHERARQRGLDLNARDFASEAELYDAVGLCWVPPELRDDDEALRTAEHESFDDLLDLAEIRGLVHCHTSYSDGRNSVLEMARAAEALGMQYITITDHSPSAHYAGGVTQDLLERQWDEIAAAQEQTQIRILRGTESDILRDGALDYPDKVLEQLDVVIASIHARHRLDRAEMTARLVRAMSLPFFKIWGHGLGRILKHRDPIDCDVPAVLDALAKAGGAIELNADPYRLDLPPAWIPAARARNIPFVVSVDAHSTRGFGVLRYGVTMARRGGLRADQVLNTLGAADFIARVRPTR
jgi:DNA polymerase (family 10)